MQKFIMCGRLCADPEIRYSGDKVIASFSVAVDRKFKRDNEPSADFFRTVSFGKQAEFCEKYLIKGTKVIVTGRIETDNYTNKNGEKVYGVKVIAEEIEFAESKKTAEENKDSAPKSNKDSDDGFVNVPNGTDEELPFN